MLDNKAAPRFSGGDERGADILGLLLRKRPALQPVMDALRAEVGLVDMQLQPRQRRKRRLQFFPRARRLAFGADAAQLDEIASR